MFHNIQMWFSWCLHELIHQSKCVIKSCFVMVMYIKFPTMNLNIIMSFTNHFHLHSISHFIPIELKYVYNLSSHIWPTYSRLIAFIIAISLLRIWSLWCQRSNTILPSLSSQTPTSKVFWNQRCLHQYFLLQSNHQHRWLWL